MTSLDLGDFSGKEEGPMIIGAINVYV